MLVEADYLGDQFDDGRPSATPGAHLSHSAIVNRRRGSSHCSARYAGTPPPATSGRGEGFSPLLSKEGVAEGDGGGWRKAPLLRQAPPPRPVRGAPLLGQEGRGQQPRRAKRIDARPVRLPGRPRQHQQIARASRVGPMALRLASFADTELARCPLHQSACGRRRNHDQQRQYIRCCVEEIVARRDTDRLQRRPERAGAAEQ